MLSCCAPRPPRHEGSHQTHRCCCVREDPVQRRQPCNPRPSLTHPHTPARPPHARACVSHALRPPPRTCTRTHTHTFGDRQGEGETRGRTEARCKGRALQPHVHGQGYHCPEPQANGMHTATARSTVEVFDVGLGSLFQKRSRHLAPPCHVHGLDLSVARTASHAPA